MGYCICIFEVFTFRIYLYIWGSMVYCVRTFSARLWIYVYIQGSMGYSICTFEVFTFRIYVYI